MNKKFVYQVGNNKKVQILLISKNSALVLIHTLVSHDNHTYWHDFGGTYVTSLSVLS
jgi:hypothetical protein